MNFLAQPLQNSDPEIASLLEQARKGKQSAICLLPGESFITPRVQAISDTSFKKDSYDSILPHVAALVGFDWVDLRLNARHEAILCAIAAATYGDNKAGVLYLDLVGFQDGRNTHSFVEVIRQQYANTETFIGDLDLKRISEIQTRIETKLVVVDASMYPLNIDFGRFRALADRTEAYLAIDIGCCAGLAAAKLYDSSLLAADFVIGDARGTLGGPSGVLLFSSGRFEPPLAVMIDQYTGEDSDNDIGLMMANAFAIEQASTEQGQQVQSQSVKNARTLLASLRNQGIQTLFETTDTHLVYAELASHLDPSQVAKSLFEIGILASAGTATMNRPTKVLCLGTSVVTNQGMGESEMQMLAEVIAMALSRFPQIDSADLRRRTIRLSSNFQ